MSGDDEFIPEEDFDAVNQEGSISDAAQEPLEECESVATEEDEQAFVHEVRALLRKGHVGCFT